MTSKKNVFVIIGSASRNSTNHKLVDLIADLSKDELNLTVYDDLKFLPHFDPDLSSNQTPEPILQFRNAVSNADGVIISTPEYVFSLPSGLKNAIEWCVSTTVFSNKPMGLITASLSGQKAHEELQLIMKTLLSRFTPDTTLIISGIKGKLSTNGEIKDAKTITDLKDFIAAFKSLLTNDSHNEGT